MADVSSAPVIGVLALHGDVREHLIARAAADAVPRQVRRPEELAEVDGLVIPGGESTTISKLAVLFGVMDPLRTRVRAGRRRARSVHSGSPPTDAATKMPAPRRTWSRPMAARTFTASRVTLRDAPRIW